MPRMNWIVSPKCGARNGIQQSTTKSSVSSQRDAGRQAQAISRLSL